MDLPDHGLLLVHYGLFDAFCLLTQTCVGPVCVWGGAWSEWGSRRVAWQDEVVAAHWNVEEVALWTCRVVGVRRVPDVREAGSDWILRGFVTRGWHRPNAPPCEIAKSGDGCQIVR